VLGGILTAWPGASGTLSTGVGLLSVYSLGLAVPFLLAALALDPFLRVSRGLRPYLPWVERGRRRPAGGRRRPDGHGHLHRPQHRPAALTPDWLFQRL
jgi:hypothetical protein